MSDFKGVQIRLVELGFEPGVIDGIWGPKTNSALDAFLKSQSLDLPRPVEIHPAPTKVIGPMRVSDLGMLEIAEHEGVVPAPYRDSAGIWTYGVGHTAFAGDPDPANMPKGMPADLDAAVLDALRLFRTDLGRYEARVNDAIRVPLKQHEFDALVSFDFNTGGIHRARLTKAINGGDRDAARHFMGWLKPPEIRKRRTAEQRLFITGDYRANGSLVPVWSVNAAGKLGQIVKVMNSAELLGKLKD